PLEPRDMLCLPRLSGPAVSPDGTYVVYSLFQYSPEDNSSTRSLRLLRLCDRKAINLTSPSKDRKDDGPIWLDDTTIAYLSTSEGRTHIWTISVDRDIIQPSDQSSQGRTSPGLHVTSPTQLTHFPIDVANLTFHRESGYLAFSAHVFPDSTMEETAKRLSEESSRHDTALTFDALPVRHWDTFVPKTRSHLFLLPLDWGSLESGHAKIWSLAQKEGKIAKPLDLLKGTAYESPVAPFGDSADYAFSPRGTELTFVAKVPAGSEEAWQTRQHIYVVPTDASSPPKSVSPQAKGACSQPSYSPDGKYLAWLSMPRAQYEADRLQIVLLDRSSGTLSYPVPNWDRSPSSLKWSPESDALLLIVPEEGRDRLYRLFLEEEDRGEVDTPEPLTSNSMASGPYLLLAQSSMTSPTELYALGLGEGGEAEDKAEDILSRDGSSFSLIPPHRLTHESDPTLRTLSLSSPEDVWFNGAHGDPVHGWLLKPHGYRPGDGTKYPMAFIVHGGPQGAIQDSFSTRWNPAIFAAAGYAVLAINFHGSTGYGQAFTDSIQGQWGAAPFEDLMLGLDHVLSLHSSWIDPDRVAGLGASYGGYMMNWINGHTDRFSCLVNHDGMFSTTGTYYTTEELYFPEHEFGGTPWENPEIYNKWSPSNFVQNWKTPTLVIHGGKDYRLVDGEGLSTFTALQRQRIPSKLVYFPDENHWVLKPANSLRWHKEVLAWMQHW
ncbi:Alpha/Beta hydrolase protein, partial [Piptocephalis cylindrospora]